MFWSCPSAVFVHPDRYYYRGLNNFDKIDREYSLACIDDLIRFWRSKVKVEVYLLVDCYHCIPDDT